MCFSISKHIGFRLCDLSSQRANFYQIEFLSNWISINWNFYPTEVSSNCLYSFHWLWSTPGPDRMICHARWRIFIKLNFYQVEFLSSGISIKLDFHQICLHTFHVMWNTWIFFSVPVHTTFLSVWIFISFLISSNLISIRQVFHQFEFLSIIFITLGYYTNHIFSRHDFYQTELKLILWIKRI